MQYLSITTSRSNYHSILQRRVITFITARISHRRRTPWLAGYATQVRTTTPSSSKPMENGHSSLRKSRPDQGYLHFTQSSLYRLTLPLPKPHVHPHLRVSRETTLENSDKAESPDGVDSDVSGAERAQDKERGEEDGISRKPSEEDEVRESKEEDAHVSTDSVVFLLHSGQPLSYIASVILAESPTVGKDDDDRAVSEGRKQPTISFHLPSSTRTRYSPSTGIGDFLRLASRAGEFTVRIGSRDIRVSVPSFEDRTRFLRHELELKTKAVERMAEVKELCDRAARKATQRKAVAGLGGLGVWWVLVGYLTFRTELGWDTMEPITYLTSLATVIIGYLWFLWHNREVSYRTVLTETTSKAQRRLYAERGFNTEKYNEFLEEMKDLRRDIKRIAAEYGLQWEQGKTTTGKEASKALMAVRRTEHRDNGRGVNGAEESDAGEDEPENKKLHP